MNGNTIKKGKTLITWPVVGILLFILQGPIVAQTNIYGTIKDEVTNKPIPFAAVVEKGQTNGVVTDLDGKFSFTVKSLPVQLSISLIGYEAMEVYVEKLPINLLLKPTVYQLKEAQIRPGENPADAIMRRVIANRDSLNPENLQSFVYHTYNKTLFTARKDSVINPLSALLGVNDSSNKAMEDLFNRQHLFINESVTQKKYKRPGNFHETILASRTSGLKDPIFSTLTTQLQSISFYDNSSFRILSTEYNNPLSNDAFSNYKFNIQDTTFSNADTVVIISFMPKAGKKQKGLVGLLYINLYYDALELAKASPATTDQMQLNVQQVYQRFDDGHWFPSQQNTDILMNQLKVGNHKIVVEARTYISDVKINPKLKSNEFGALEVEVDKDAVKNQELILPEYRQNELDRKDSATYTSIDSLSKQLKLEKRLDFLEAALDGKIRISILDIPIDKVIGFNNYEGFRLGIGLETNHRMLKWMRLGGYFAYGFNDNAIKYGGFVEFIPHQRLDIRIKLDYKRDVFSSGQTDFPQMGPIVLNNLTNQLVLNVFDSIQWFEGSFSIRPFLNWQLRFAMNHQKMDPTLAYRYLPDTTQNQHYNLTEIDISTRWGIKEKYIAVGRRYIAKPSAFPVIHLHITQSLPGLGGEFSYTKLLGRVSQTFYIRKLGKTSVMLEGGYIFGDAPYAKLFANRGSFANFSIVSRNSFETMRSNEFLMDSYVSVYFAHNFGTLFRVKKFIRPELSLVHNLGFGWLKEPLRHSGIPFKTMKHGFFEGGIVLDNILVISNMGLGVGAFYRYGSTASANPLENFYIKMAIATSF
jgi:Family of unknown function (DUF5686)/CarboxypepD_reg-like domain